MPRRNRPARPGGTNAYSGVSNTGGGGTAPATGGGGTTRRPRRDRRVPQGGLYGGKPGEALTNQDPMAYFERLLSGAGLYTNSGSDFDVFARDQMLTDMKRQYDDAVGLNQRLSAADWARETYGAGFDGPKKKPGSIFTAGTLGTNNDYIKDLWATNQANASPLSYITSQGLGGSMSGMMGNDEFSNWFNTQYAPEITTAWEGYEGANAGANVNDWWTQNQAKYAGDAQNQFDISRSNADPTTWATQRAGARGMLASNGNQQFQDWYTSVYAPQLQREFETARTNNASLNFRDFEASRDPEMARRLYANRAPQFRQPTANVPAGGRWSWWT